MTLNEQILQNLYAELFMVICHYEQVEEKYIASIIAQKKLVEQEKQ